IFRMRILAARRVFPPLLITPAKASKPFMKLTGPDAIPPPDRVSLLPRRVEKFVPVPEPHLKSIPSVRDAHRRNAFQVGLRHGNELLDPAWKQGNPVWWRNCVWPSEFHEGF